MLEAKTCHECGAELPIEIDPVCPKCGALWPSPSGEDDGSTKVIRRTAAGLGIPALTKLFPKLEIQELINHGPTGTYYKARQPAKNRYVTLKLFPVAVARNAEFAENFEGEAQKLVKLKHPNIASVYEYGTAGGMYYLVMEYVAGESLRHQEASRRFTAQETLAIVLKICNAVQYALDNGVVHRDIHPDSILLDQMNGVKLVDFGLEVSRAGLRKSKLTATQNLGTGTSHRKRQPVVEPSAGAERTTILRRPSGESIAIKGTTSIGRAPTNTIVFPDDNISRHHTLIQIQNEGEFWLMDLHSTNGTWLNGRRITQPVQLRTGDEFAVGPLEFTFLQTEKK